MQHLELSCRSRFGLLVRGVELRVGLSRAIHIPNHGCGDDRSFQVFTGHSGPVRCGQFSPDGKLVVTGGGEGDESLKVWDPKNGVCILTVQDPHTYHTAGESLMCIFHGLL